MKFRSIVSDIPFHPSRVQDADALALLLHKRHLLLRIAAAASILLLAVNTLVAITLTMESDNKPSATINRSQPDDDLLESSEARNLTSYGDYSNDIEASPGEIVEFRYTLTNQSATNQSYSLEKDISDITQYAYVIDASGGSLSTEPLAKISWPATDLTPNESISRTLLVKIMSPLPATPDDSTDSTLGDYKLQTGDGDRQTTVSLPVPTSKRIERQVEKLPQIPLGGVMLSLSIFLFVSYFYVRNQILLHEIKTIRNSHNAK